MKRAILKKLRYVQYASRILLVVIFVVIVVALILGLSGRIR
jgi:predicted nucleic acid-binding Zn ribbon protein